MKKLILKQLFKQGIILSLIVSLAFTPVFALESGTEVSDQASAEASEPVETDETSAEQTEQAEKTEQQPEPAGEAGQAATQDEPAETKEIKSISASSADGGEAVQEYEEGASSWRFQDGEILREDASSMPKLYASFTPWTWSSSKGGYLSSNGTVISGAIRKGVDVSKWQEKIDWAKVKQAGIGFAIIRCGFGSDYTDQDDEYWIYNVQQCEKYGIPYGVYLYSYANTDAKAKSEAQHVLRCLKEANASPDYPIYYDLEDEVVGKCGKTAIVRRAKLFCDAIEAQGYRAGIYANLNWWNNYLNDSSLNKYEKWVAQWNSKCTYTGSYRIWQSTSDGSVAGIDGRVDVNFEFQRDDTAYYMGMWTKDEKGNTVFQKGDGTIAKSQWVVYKGSKYYVDANGAMQKNKWFTVSGKKYYASSTGALVKGYKKIGSYYYYFDSNYAMQKSKWLTLSGKKYYASSTGNLLTGKKKVGSYYYYFNASGVMQKSKWLTISKKKHYAASTGRLVTGYKKIGSYYYGFNSSGTMLTGTQAIGGKRYKFASTGKAYLFTAKTKTALNYRTGPSAKYKKKGTYKKNKSFTIIRQQNGWGQMTNGYWVKLSYTKKTATYPQFIAYKVKTTTGLNYRTGPSGSYKKKGVLKKGKVVTIKSAKNGWGKMSNGYWIKLSYTKKV